jgi:hypothetical protein
MGLSMTLKGISSTRQRDELVPNDKEV